MVRSAEAQGKPTSLQLALILAGLVIVLVTAMWPSSTDPEPGLWVGLPVGTATSSVQMRMAPSQDSARARPADCHPPKLVNQPRAEC